MRSAYYVGINGVDDLPVLRHGDISLTGAYFTLVQPVGDVGSMQMITVGSRERAHWVRVLSRVTRLISLFAAESTEPIYGVAVEFMPDTPETRAALDRVVQEIVTLQLEEDVQIHVGDDFAIDIKHPTGQFRLITSQYPLVGRLPEAGELGQICFDQTPGVFWRAKVTGVTAADGDAPAKLEIELEWSAGAKRSDSQDNERAAEFDGATEVNTGTSIAAAVEQLFIELAAESSREPKNELFGQLTRIGVPTLLSLFSLERLTGELKAIRGDCRATIFVVEGDVIDAVLEPSELEPIDALAEVCRWADGTFEFSDQNVERKPRIEMSTTALLLNLARREDEAKRTSSH
ncbi:MAG: DUF4388 domain-containing protein [Deltaproteobacteria bacterium]|nr:DUF4388 domain-containing protein [Deltaproteobacteria bacterium]